jgi:hypothetical protein
MSEVSLQNISTTIESLVVFYACSFWEDDNFRDRGEFANSATDGCFSGVSHPEISDECFNIAIEMLEVSLQNVSTTIESLIVF